MIKYLEEVPIASLHMLEGLNKYNYFNFLIVRPPSSTHV